MDVTLVVWGVVNVVVLLPVGLSIRMKRKELLPVILYGFGVWIFLVAGVPFLDSPYGGRDWIIGYSCLITVTTIPMWLTLFLYMHRRPRLGSGRRIAVHEGQLVWRGHSDRHIFYAIWIISLLGIIHYLYALGATPFYIAMTSSEGLGVGDTAQLMNVRRSATYTESFGLYSTVFYVTPLLAATLGHILYRSGHIRLLTNLLSILSAAVISIQFLHKTYVLFLVVQLFLADFIVGGYSLRQLIIYACTAIALTLAAYVFYIGYIDIAILENMVRRVSVAYIRSIEFVFNSWPTRYAYFYGATFPNPLGIFSYEPVNLSGIVMHEMRGRIGNIPVPAVGGGYANFGYWGVTLITLLIAGWLSFLVVAFRWFRRSRLGMAIWVMMSFNVMAFSRNEFFTSIGLRFLALIVLLYVLKLLLRGDWINSRRRQAALGLAPG